MSYEYNGVIVQYCKTLSFEMIQELDPSGVDALWNMYTIRVRGFVSGPDATGGPGVFDQDTSAVLNRIKNQLETPRRSLKYGIGSTTLVSIADGPVAGVGTALDAKLGPFPLAATVTEVASGCYMVECGVVVRIASCDDQTFNGNPVVSLRWSQTESFDQNWYSNLSTSGKLIVRSDLRLTADFFRPLTTPPLLPDYLRKKSSYTMSPSGTELDFVFEDQEVDRLPPFAATTATGTFLVTVEKNQKRMGQCTVDLEGPKGASRRQLMTRAIAMCYSKLEAETFLAEGCPPILWGEFREDLFKVAVHVTMKALLVPTFKAGGGGVAAPIGGAVAVAAAALKASAADGGIPPPQVMKSVGLLPAGVSENLPGIGGPTRKRLAALLCAAFRDPCLDPQSLPLSPLSPASSVRDLTSIPRAPNAVASLTVGTTVPYAPKTTIKDAAPYDTYMVETTVTWDSGKAHMPGTGVGPTAGIGALLTSTGGMMKMWVSWVASRTGRPPVLPAYDVGNANVVPLGGSLTGKDAEVSADGNSVTQMTAGYYVYAVLNPALFQMVNPVPPFFAPLISAAVLAGNTNYADLYQFQGAAGSNPFVPGGSQIGGAPQHPPGMDGVIGVGSVDPQNPDWAAGTSGNQQGAGPPVGP